MEKEPGIIGEAAIEADAVAKAEAEVASVAEGLIEAVVGVVSDKAVPPNAATASDAHAEIPDESQPKKRRNRLLRNERVVKWFDMYKDRKTPQLLMQIWSSDWSIAAFLPMGACFYLMKMTGWPWVGLLFFLLAMSTVDAILSIFVVRLSFHQNKSGFYRTEDYERDWLRYRVLLSMTKTALFFVVGLGSGWLAIIGGYTVWFFTSCERLRYVILRWELEKTFPDLERWSIFAILKEFKVKPTLRNFDIVALIGLILGFGITLL